MKLDRFQSPSTPPSNGFEKDLERALDKVFTRAFDILNVGILFADNFDAYITTITTDATPGNSTAIPHGLKRIPSGLIILERLNKGGDIYLVSKDATTYTLASDVASLNAKIMIF